jgi:membrane-associated phospholipid phosphatase
MANSARPSRLALPIAIGVLGAASILLCILAPAYGMFQGDLKIALWLQGFNNGFFLSTMRGISWLFGGWRPAVIIIASAAFVLVKLGARRAALAALAGICASSSSPLKFIVGRPRPTPDLVRVLDVETNGSFPSGHVLFVTIVLGFLAYLSLRSIQNRALRAASVVVLAALMILTGVSRVYLGAHWPSDTLGGYVIGGFFVSVLIYFDRILSPRSTGVD